MKQVKILFIHFLPVTKNYGNFQFFSEYPKHVITRINLNLSFAFKVKKMIASLNNYSW